MKIVTIIIPSYNDLRIFNAINSIVRHRDSLFLKILVQDGGSEPSFIAELKKSLRDDDELSEEGDNGVFDALNKAVLNVKTEWIGWIGSDDLLNIDFSVEHLLNHAFSIVAFETIFFKSNPSNVRRYYYVAESRMLRSFGFHLPHFSTFVRRELAQSTSFDSSCRNFADQLYFLELESRNEVKVVHKVSTLMEIGGISNASIYHIFKTNYNVFLILNTCLPAWHAGLYICGKFVYKLSQVLATLLIK